MKTKILISLADMTDAQYERYLKRNHFTGLAAARMDGKRRAAIAAKTALESSKP